MGPFSPRQPRQVLAPGVSLAEAVKCCPDTPDLPDLTPDTLPTAPDVRASARERRPRPHDAAVAHSITVKGDPR